MAGDNSLKIKIQVLEEEIKRKDLELARYRKELAHANDEIERIIADLGEELKFANNIQKLLSPTEIPNIQGVEFSTKFNAGNEFGGDYFDIFELEDKMRFGVIVASSSGYAMSALFLSVLIKMASQIEARKGMEPSIVLANMAKELIPSIKSKDTASVFYGLFDRRTFELRYSAAGNILAMHQPHGQEKLIKLESAVPAFSKDFNHKPLSQTIQLGAKDRIVLCTEGVYQAESFSSEKLQKAVLSAPKNSVHNIRNEILYQVQKISGNTETARDQTVVVLEIKDRVIKLAKNK